MYEHPAIGKMEFAVWEQGLAGPWAMVPAEFIHEEGRIISLLVVMEANPGIDSEIFRR